MLCKLCFVSVKKVEKRVNWLLVSVEEAPSETLVDENVLVLCSKSKENPINLKDQFPGHGNLRSHATSPPRPCVAAAAATANTHPDIFMHTRRPVLLRRREMLSNSAFQHSTSDYLFSFTGRFELVMYFPFGVGRASLSVSLILGESLLPSA